MRTKILRFLCLAAALVAMALIATPHASAAPAFGADRFLVRAQKGADLAQLQKSIGQAGGKVIKAFPQINLLLVTGNGKLSMSSLQTETGVAQVAHDHMMQLVRPSQHQELFGKPFTTDKKLSRTQVNTKLAPRPAISVAGGFMPDPTYYLDGTQWSQIRVGALQAWGEIGGTGTPAVTVGVMDTGIDYTHVDLARNVIDVHDFTYLEAPYNICRDYVGGFTDQDLADQFGGPVNGDWNGHGSWIGGNIAGVANGTGMNGIAPDVKLVALKISQWCGSAWDSEMIAALLYAADAKLDVVNISFGGYLDHSNPEQALIWNAWLDAVKYATVKGVTVVSSSGNDHVRLGKKGVVKTHGILTAPGSSAASDYFGLYENPAGIPGVVAVSATNDVTQPSSANCDPNDIGSKGDFNATCKPDSDAHQPFGVGFYNQLAYYSNYGPRITVSAPGGARKFNMPYWDRGGTPGFPYTNADGQGGTRAWESFSVTSNWAIEIPCYIWQNGDGAPYFPDNQCYTSIQGTSMSSPHAAAVVAQIASARPDLRGIPKALIALLKASAEMPKHQQTPPTSPTDTSSGDLSGVACDTGNCHLGGAPISKNDAFGVGLVNGYNAIH